jgi:NADH-quinone oxidoreductase subunit L
MFRLFFLTFHGSFRGRDYKIEDVHESGWKMTTPLLVLAVLSVLGGVLNLPHYLTHEDGFLNQWLNPIYLIHRSPIHPEITSSIEAMLVGIAVLAFFIGWAFSRNKYITKSKDAEKEEKGLLKWIQSKLYIDELYDKIFIKPIEFLGDILFALVDTLMLYGLTFAVYPVLNFIGRRNQRIQNGNIEFYLIYMVGAIALLLGIYLLFV